MRLRIEHHFHPIVRTDFFETIATRKRNFFPRGFFKKRGYYNLTHMPPDRYRTSKVFSSSRNRRAWPQAPDLFQIDPTGDEVLTIPGKSRINAVVAQWRNSLGGPPLIIEGYSAVGDPADRLASSRRRAALVRDCVRRRLHLDQQKVAIEALGNQPPVGLDKDKWNEVCLIL